MPFQTHVEAILKPCRYHITIVGTNMALIWLRYGFDMAFKKVIWKYYLSYMGIWLPVLGEDFWNWWYNSDIKVWKFKAIQYCLWAFL